MQDRSANWSEGRGFTEDAMHGLGVATELDVPVQDLAVKKGVLLLSDCPHCSRQNKSLLDWAEISIWDMKRTQLPKKKDGSPQWVWEPQIERPTRQGLFVALQCNGCQKPFPVLCQWDELRRWIDVGVQSGCLKPQIYDLSRRR